MKCMSEEGCVYWGTRLWIRRDIDSKETSVKYSTALHTPGGVQFYVKVGKDGNFPIPFKLLFLL